MNTPVCDFVRRYRESGTLRLHMPGHKGQGFPGAEDDLTEIEGADTLYPARGIIRESEENAASLFGAGRTVYSAEGSSLCVRAMALLALREARRRGRAPLFLAGRNAHRAFLSALALLDADAEWLCGGDLLSCVVTPEAVDKALAAMNAPPAAVYLTSPDYLGNLLDIREIAAVCHRRDVPLLVDNAHGAYLKFLPEDLHPLSLGADMACDSAHKTLPVLTGGAYLHIAKNAPALFAEEAERAFMLFASTSPSYLILQSLDRCNAVLAGDYRERLAETARAVAGLKERLAAQGFAQTGREPMKITLTPKSYGYTGDRLHEELRRKGVECEFSDPDFLTMMVSPETGAAGLSRLEDALRSVPRRAPIDILPPAVPHPRRALSIREAVLSPSVEIPAEQALGKTLCSARVSCPPAVPIALPGELIDEAILACFRYYGVDRCRVACNNQA